MRQATIDFLKIVCRDIWYVHNSIYAAVDRINNSISSINVYYMFIYRSMLYGKCVTCIYIHAAYVIPSTTFPHYPPEAISS